MTEFTYKIGVDGLAWIYKKDLPNQVKTQSACGPESRGCRKIRMTLSDEYIQFLKDIKAATGTSRYYVIDDQTVNDPESKGIIV